MSTAALTELLCFLSGRLIEDGRGWIAILDIVALLHGAAGLMVWLIPSPGHGSPAVELGVAQHGGKANPKLVDETLRRLVDEA
jgi:hypothetical protein